MLIWFEILLILYTRFRGTLTFNLSKMRMKSSLTIQYSQHLFRNTLIPHIIEIQYHTNNTIREYEIAKTNLLRQWDVIASVIPHSHKRFPQQAINISIID